MRLTKKQAYSNHYELWDCMYNNPSEYKDYWHRWEENGGDIVMVTDYCFLCEWFTTRGRCNKCPLGSGCKLYYKWYHAKTLKTRKKYAKLIRDIVIPQ